MKNSDIPAMPFQEVQGITGGMITRYTNHKGLTKREELSRSLMANLIQGGAISEIGNEQWYAERVCKFADALLAELEK
jgi:hypothetical protein